MLVLRVYLYYTWMFWHLVFSLNFTQRGMLNSKYVKYADTK